MPKVTDTRKQRAAELRARLLRGPKGAFETEHFAVGGIKTEAERYSEYTNWLHSWIIGELDDLIPELRVAKQQETKQLSPKAQWVLQELYAGYEAVRPTGKSKWLITSSNGSDLHTASAEIILQLIAADHVYIVEEMRGQRRLDVVKLKGAS